MTPLWSLILAVMAVAAVSGIYAEMAARDDQRRIFAQADRFLLQFDLDQANGLAVVEDGARRFRMAHDREAAKALNSVLWQIIGDYRAGLVPLEVATRAWDYERAHAEHSALWRGYLPVFQKNFTIKEMTA